MGRPLRSSAARAVGGELQPVSQTVLPRSQALPKALPGNVDRRIGLGFARYQGPRYIDAHFDSFKEDSMADISVQVLDNGPLLVTGGFDLQDGSGSGMTKDEGRPIALCRCGASEAKPFCDG